MKKLNFEYVKEFIESKGFCLLDDEYLNSKQKLNIKDSFGYLYQVSLDGIKVNTNLLKFSISNLYTIENIVNWIKINKKPFEFTRGQYLGNDIRSLTFYCCNCEREWDTCWSSIIHVGTGCPYCGKKILGDINLENQRPDISKEWNYSKNTSSPSEYFQSSSKRVWWLCSKCGHEWEATIANRTSKKGTGCPRCNINLSKGVVEIEKILISFDVNYILEKTFKNCRYKLPLPFDFYLPEFNACIEYQGEHHYMPVRYGNRSLKSSEEEFELWKIKDEIKENFCIRNKINLIKIPYWEFDNIYEILKCFLY